MSLSALLPIPKSVYIDTGIGQHVIQKVYQDGVEEIPVPIWEIVDSSLIGCYPELGYQMIAVEKAIHDQGVGDPGEVSKDIWATKVFFR